MASVADSPAWSPNPVSVLAISVRSLSLSRQVTKGRVSPRRAAVLGYLTNQLLHSHRAIDKEEENEPQPFIFDLPRPKRD